MKIYKLSAELESAVNELLEDASFIFLQRSNSDSPAYVKVLRHLKASRPGVFQIQRTGAQSDHPGDKMMWEILSAREKQSLWSETWGQANYNVKHATIRVGTGQISQA
jgi:hypothetical protein